MNWNIFNLNVIANLAKAKFPAIFKFLKVEDPLKKFSSRKFLGVTFTIFAGRQKRHDLISQSGRSMIEMLGVLAIIGVLSISGLAGYSKAVDKYRVNETINQVTYIVQNTRDLFRTQPNYYGSMSFDTSPYMSNNNNVNRILADKAKLFPDSLIKNNYKNLWDGEIKFYNDGRFSDDDGKAFVLVFYGIPQEACVEIVTRDWQSFLGLIGMTARGSKKTNIHFYSNNCTTSYQTGKGLFCAARHTNNFRTSCGSLRYSKR